MIAWLSRLNRPAWVGVASGLIGLIGLIGLVGLLFWGAAAVGLRWDPFDLDGKRLDRAEARADAAVSDAEARRAEVAGERLQSGRVETFHQTNRAVERATDAAGTEARRADDADDPLDEARAARLRAHDRSLRGIAAGADGRAAAPDPA